MVDLWLKDKIMITNNKIILKKFPCLGGCLYFFHPHMPILLHFLNVQVGGEIMNNSKILKNGPNLN
jgi:hypothetical protein